MEMLAKTFSNSFCGQSSVWKSSAYVFFKDGLASFISEDKICRGRSVWNNACGTVSCEILSNHVCKAELSSARCYSAGLASVPI